MERTVKRNAVLAVGETERKKLETGLVPAVSMVEHTAQTLEMAAGLFQRDVIYNIEGRRIVASPATLLHDAEKLFCDAEKKATPVVGRIGQ